MAIPTEDGRGSRIRTRDLRFWRPPLYQLSYTPFAFDALLLTDRAALEPLRARMFVWGDGMVIR